MVTAEQFSFANFGFHGPYNTLLCTLFPADIDFSVFPRYRPNSEGAPVRNFLDVMYREKEVFILEHRPEMVEFSYESFLEIVREQCWLN